MTYEEKTMKSEKIYEGKILTLRIDTVELPNKKYSKREIIEHPGAVAIIPLTDDGDIILVNQFRKAIESDLLEIPAGKLEPEENPLSCAIRELKEETGYYTDQMESLGYIYTAPGFCDEKIHLYVAKNLTEGEPEPDADEYIEVQKISINRALDMIGNGQIVDAKTISAILMLNNKLNKVK